MDHDFFDATGIITITTNPIAAMAAAYVAVYHSMTPAGHAHYEAQDAALLEAYEANSEIWA
jgi:hypothetical protein